MDSARSPVGFCNTVVLGGALTLHFIYPNPATARNVLGLYIKNLSDKLRQSQAHSAAAARASLTDEAKRTSDLLLQNQLYELIARQLEQEKVAEAETDFAFKTIQTPVVPDRPFKPRVALDTVLACVLASFIACFGIAFKAATDPEAPVREVTTIDTWNRRPAHHPEAGALREVHRDGSAVTPG